MSDAAREYRKEVVRRVLEGPGTASAAARQAAFDNSGVDSSTSSLIAKVTTQAWTVTGDDVTRTKDAGVSEDEIFELVVAAALGQATRQLDAALAALDAATGPAVSPASTTRDGGPR